MTAGDGLAKKRLEQVCNVEANCRVPRAVEPAKTRRRMETLRDEGCRAGHVNPAGHAE